MNLHTEHETPFHIQLSFERIVHDLEKISADEAQPDVAQKKALLQEIKKHPELVTGIQDSKIIEENENLIRQMLADYFPSVLTLNEIKAVNIPFTNIFFNYTERFKNILRDAGDAFDLTIRDFDEHKFYVRSCCIILSSYYGIQVDPGLPIFYDIPTKGGPTKHYRILYNADFLEISPGANAVALTERDIRQLKDNYHDLSLWKEKFPLNSWILKGFALITLFDSTTENAVSVLKEKLLGLNVQDFGENMGRIFQSIYQIPDLQVGYTGFREHDGILIRESFGRGMQSFILRDQLSANALDLMGSHIYNKLIYENEIFSVSETGAGEQHDTISASFFDQKFKSFILAPVVKDGKVLGILEVVSIRDNELNSINAQKLEVVMPFLTDTMERLLFELENKIHAVIQENYTTIHASVYWRFKDEARKFIQKIHAGENYDLQEIVFTDIYPLYAQVDIKDSSDTRSRSVQTDLRGQLDAVSELLEYLSNGDHEKFIEEKRQISNFTYELNFPLKADTEQQIQYYVEKIIHPLLKGKNNGDLLVKGRPYFSDCEKGKGNFFRERRKYENTVTRINKILCDTLDRMQADVQELIPHYYERFKTDGVEHNLYIGISLTRANTFTLDDLHALKLWQLKALCEMERAHYKEKSSLPLPLDVRSLLLAFHSTIAIRFRMDEKRFDVDGSYNTRYEVIKKRIDKAYMKNTSERITHAGKITIVYSNQAEEVEYLQYLKELNTLGLVEENVEQHDVEDLPGVAGLKVLRVNIRYLES